MSRLPFKEAVTHNMAKQCDATGCQHNRVTLGKFCNQHKKMLIRNGHPLQRTTRGRAYANEKYQVEEILEGNLSHQGINNAVQWVASWMSDAVAGKTLSKVHGTIVAPVDMRRLADSGVAPIDIIVEAAALWIYQQHNRHKFESDEAEEVALSNAVLSLAPRSVRTSWSGVQGKTVKQPVKITTKTRKELGRRLKLHLLPLFHNFKTTIENNSKVQKTAREAMFEPLSIPIKLTTAHT
jgi:hypothetical protein